MGAMSVLVDLVILLFSVLLLLVIPLLDAQLVLPLRLFPKRLVELKRRQEEENGDYLMREGPPFFVGIVWVELLLQWPLYLATVYGILAGRAWVDTTILMLGVSNVTSMAAIMGELLGSGRASEKFVRMGLVFVLFSFLAIFRGLFPLGIY